MATELGKAYVQIVPSAEGISSKIKEALGEPIASQGETSGESFAAKLTGTIKKAIAAAGIGTALKSAISEGAALEQSIGGIETLFKDSADTMKQYAAQAYQTAGISANDYMEQSTSFAASLLSSLGGDTAAAAETANQAIIDMADNSNKMGTSLQDIQNAYQGFAKQNYTMLDNLKLGYGGTKTEMERLLADAQELSGVEYNIDNLSDVYEAIHVIQENLDITGTTAKEAATTFSGSFAAMKAAAENFMGNLALGEDVTDELQELVETTKTFLVDNALPMVGNILTTLPTLLPEAVAGITGLIGEIVPKIPEFMSGILDAIGHGLSEGLSSLGMDEEATALSAVFSGLSDAVTIVSDALGNFISWLTSGSTSAEVFKAALVAVAAGFTAFSVIQSVTTWIQSAQKVFAVFNTVLAANPIMIVVVAVAALAAGIIYLWNNCESFRNAVITIWSAVQEAFSTAIEAIKGFFTGLGEKVSSVWESITSGVQTVVETMVSIWSSIVSAVQTAWNTITGVIQVAVMVIKEIISAAVQLWLLPWKFIWENFGTQLTAAWETIKSYISTALETISTIISDVWNAIVSFLSPILEGIANTFSTIWNGITNAVSTAVNTVSSVVSSVFTAIKTFVTNTWNSIKTTTTNVWNGIKTAIMTPINAAKPAISNAIDSIKTNITSKFNAIKTTATSVWNAIKTAITTPITTAKDTVKSMIDKMKSFFNFTWSLPKLKLPHFSITGSFGINPPSVPHFSISWYKKAMDTPMLLDTATIFGASGNTLLGGGEAGPEVVAGAATLKEMFGAAAFDAVEAGQNETVDQLDRLLALLGEYLPMMAQLRVYLDTGKLVGGIAPEMDTALGQLSDRRLRTT